MESLEKSDKTFILDGMIRVDLFCSNEGNLVVNELEGLEAAYYASSFSDQIRTESFLENYWENKILELLSNFMP